MIVLDASVVVELLLGGGRSPALHGRLATAGATWHAPGLVQVEVTSVLRRLNLAKQLSDLRGRQALQTLSSLDLPCDWTGGRHAVVLAPRKRQS